MVVHDMRPYFTKVGLVTWERSNGEKVTAYHLGEQKIARLHVYRKNNWEMGITLDLRGPDGSLAEALVNDMNLLMHGNIQDAFGEAMDRLHAQSGIPQRDIVKLMMDGENLRHFSKYVNSVLHPPKPKPAPKPEPKPEEPKQTVVDLPAAGTWESLMDALGQAIIKQGSEAVPPAQVVKGDE